MEVHLTKGNSRNLYIEGLPPEAEVEVFISATNDDEATPVATAVEADVSFGVFDIPGEGRKPPRRAITCHKALFLGDAIAEHGAAEGQFIIFRAEPDLNQFAYLFVHDAEPIAAAL
jgi:hypothetical protein